MRIMYELFLESDNGDGLGGSIVLKMSRAAGGYVPFRIPLRFSRGELIYDEVDVRTNAISFSDIYLFVAGGLDGLLRGLEEHLLDLRNGPCRIGGKIDFRT